MKTWRGSRVQLTFSLTSALNEGGWSTPRPGRFTPEKDTPYLSCRRLVGTRAGMHGTENLAPTGIRSPYRPARRESLYRLLPRPAGSIIQMVNNIHMSQLYSVGALIAIGFPALRLAAYREFRARQKIGSLRSLVFATSLRCVMENLYCAETAAVV